MSKTKWHTRAIYIAIALALAIGLAGIAATPPDAASADPGLTKWGKVTTPTHTDGTIIPGADIYDFAIGPDGEVIYAIGKVPPRTVDDVANIDIALWKSTDGGATWSDKTAKLLEKNVKPDGFPGDKEFSYLVQVAVAPNNEDFVVVAGKLTNNGTPAVVGSTNGATKFYTTLAEITTDLKDETIYCMDVSRGIEDVYNIALGTSAGKVWRYEAGTYWGGAWAEASAYTGWQASTAVTSVAFSPSWSADKTLLAISTNSSAGKTWLQTAKWGTTKGWGSDYGRASAVEFVVDTESVEPINGAVITNLTLPTGFHGVTGMALPSDYHGRESSLRRVYAYVDVKASANVTAGGYLFRIDSTTLSIPCGPTGNPWFGSLAYHGDHDTGDAMLGMLGDGAPSSPAFTSVCTGVQVWRTDEIDLCCPDWKTATKKPSGQAYALAAFTPDGDKAYAITVGEADCLESSYADESAFSVSLDNGKCWNQLGLIDTDIDSISDMATSPDCSVTYLATMNDEDTYKVGDCDSVWMKDDNATEYADVWQRIYHKDLEGTDGLLRLSPEHDDGDVVYWGDFGKANLYWAESKGICKWSTKDAPSIDIQDFALADDDTLFVIASNEDLVKWTEAKGDWSSAVDHKAVAGHTIAVLGDYVLVGGSAGSVGYSDDAGDSFSRLGDKGELGAGEVHVAFDTYFEDNDTVYAAVKGGDKGIWRWVVDDSTSWEDLHATPSTYQLTGSGSTTDTNELDYYGIVTELSQDGNPKTKAANGGVLYAVYSGVTIDKATFSGVARCLTPAQETCCGQLSWDYLFCKLSEDEEDFSLEPSALKICGCLSKDTNSNLFAIDNRAYYEDYTFGTTYAKFITSAMGRLWTYEDCFAKAGITLEAVGDGDTVASDPCVCANEKFVLEWERLCNDCEYDLQISLDDDFTQIVLDTADLTTKYATLKGDGGFYDPPKNETPTVVIWEEAIDCNTTYYWRVRSRYTETPETIRSFWSDAWSFTVEAGPTVAIDLTSPDDGDTGIAITGIGFTWSSVADATSYDFVLSANADLSSPVETKTGLTDTAYTYTGTLDYEAVYFWRVTAMKDANVFSESDISTFTTAPEPVPAPVPPEIPPPVTPAWVWVVIGIGAVLVIVIIVLIFRTRRV